VDAGDQGVDQEVDQGGCRGIGWATDTNDAGVSGILADAGEGNEADAGDGNPGNAGDGNAANSADAGDGNALSWLVDGGESGWIADGDDSDE